MNTKINYNSLISLGFSIILVFILVLLELPQPFKDDVFFLGAAIHKTLFGTFENPYCTGFINQFGSTKAYYYLPGQTIILSFWTKLFGVSTWSFMSLYQIAIGIGSYQALKIFNFQKRFQLISLAFPIFFTLLMVYQGFRPEPLAFAFLFTGVHLFQYEKKWKDFIGIICIGWAIFTAPVLLSFYIPILLYILFFKKEKIVHFIYMNLIGLALIFGCLYLYTNGEIKEFITIFQAHAATLQFEELGYWFVIKSTLTDNHFYKFNIALYLLGLIFVVYNTYQKKYTSLFLFIGFLISIYIYPDRSLVLFGKIFMFAIITYNCCLWYKRAKLLTHAVAWGITINVHLFTLIIYLTQDYEYNPPIGLEEIDNYEYVVGDAFAARAIYDYKLPLNFKALDFYHEELTASSLQQQKPNELWIFNGAFLYRTKDTSYQTLPKGSLIGHTFYSISKYPYHLIISKSQTN